MTGLVGREAELAALHELVTDAGAGAGGVLLVSGPAGIGKSALIEVAQRQAYEKGMTVLVARGVASETLLPFGALHQLLWPLIRDGALPEEPRQSLRTALGAAGAVTPDFYAVALAALELLVEAAERNPVLVVAEDVHWFDQSSADLLGFVARRVGAAPIALVAGLRTGDSRKAEPMGEAGLPVLALGPLPEDAARILLDRADAGLSGELRERILATAGGNPLALLELPAAARGTGADEPRLPMSARLERAFSARLPEMSEQARALLLAAAAEPSGTVAQLMAAVSAIRGERVTVNVLDQAVGAGLVRPQGLHLRFRHPLVASAVYQAAAPSDRIAVHSALAGVLADQPDRAIWHRSAAATGLDPAVAEDLRTFAERAARRGAASVAVAALERGATFTEGADRMALLLRAAELTTETGQARERLPDLAAQIRNAPLAGRDLARWALVEAALAPMDDAGVVAGLAEHAARIWPDDLPVAYALLHAASIRCWWGGGKPELRVRIREVMDKIDPETADPRSTLVLSYTAPLERGRLLLRRAEALAAAPRPELRRFTVGAFAHAGDFTRAAAAVPPLLATALESGQLVLAGRMLIAQAGSSFWTGAWPSGAVAAAEAERIGREIREPGIYLLAMVYQAQFAAGRGEAEQAEAILAEVLADPDLLGNRAVLAPLQKVRGMLALTAGRAADAMDTFLTIYDEDDVHHHWMNQYYALSLLAETARSTGHADLAHAILGGLERVDDPVALVAVSLAFARAVLADDEDAEPLFEAAFTEDLARLPFERARLNLAYGRFLRRRQCVPQSRVPLRLAADLFEQLGAVPWLAMAQSELRASGVKGEAPAGDVQLLTAQELAIARLAAQGLSNREIGQQLFLSPRTVGSHLYKIFPKLGVSNRTQLANVLP